MKSILIASLALLVLPATAGAVTIVPPEVVTLCSDTGVCMTTQPGDARIGIGTPHVTNAWVQKPSGEVTTDRTGCTSVNIAGGPVVAGACTEIPCMAVTWQFTRYHQYRKTEWHLRGAARRCYPFRDDIPTLLAPGPDYVVSKPQFNTPDCNPTGDFEPWFLSPPDASGVQTIGMSPGAYAPRDFAAMCGGRAPAPTADPSTTDPTAEPKPCDAIALGKKKVAVTSRGPGCAAGRNIMARWLRRGIEPSGFVCATLRIGRARAATCAKPNGRGRASGARITGRWRA